MLISSVLTEKIKSTYFKSMVVLFASIIFLFISLFGISIELLVSLVLFSVVSIVIRFFVNDLVDVSLLEDYLIIKQSVGKNMIAPVMWTNEGEKRVVKKKYLEQKISLSLEIKYNVVVAFQIQNRGLLTSCPLVEFFF